MKDNYLPLVKRWLQIPLLLAVLLLSFAPGNTGVAHAVNCYTLTLASNPPSIAGAIDVDLAPNCGSQYTEGTVVQLTGLPNANYLFASWSGAVSGIANPVNITMNSNQTVSANFFANRWQEAIDIADIGGIPLSISGDTTAASRELGAEPNPISCNGKSINGGYETIWYKYTPSFTHLIYLDTVGSTTFVLNPLSGQNYPYDTYIAVFTSPITVSSTPVACNDDNDAGYVSQLGFNATAGTTYYIQVGQYWGLANSNVTPPYNGGNLRFNVSRFQDVPGDYWAKDFINRLYLAGVTSGCNTNPLMYCPTATVTRDQMAIFLLRGKYGSGYTPPAPSGVFQDVPTNYWAAAWIEKLAVDGITSGCSVTPKLYCPTAAVTRDQMAIFLLRAKHGAGYTPPAPSGVFQDVPTNYWAAAWIEQLAAEGITSGCSVTPKLYCPTATVTRDQMAVFLVRNFNLP